MNHPGICVGFRLQTSAGSIAYLPDNELYRRLRTAGQSESDFAERQDQKLIDFIRDVDVAIMDSQYEAEEYQTTLGGATVASMTRWMSPSKPASATSSSSTTTRTTTMRTCQMLAGARTGRRKLQNRHRRRPRRLGNGSRSQIVLGLVNFTCPFVAERLFAQVGNALMNVQVGALEVVQRPCQLQDLPAHRRAYLKLLRAAVLLSWRM